MAKYNVRQSKFDNLKEHTGKLLKFNKPPIVIPRDKLEAANLKVMKFQKQNTKLKYVIGILAVYAVVSLYLLAT